MKQILTSITATIFFIELFDTTILYSCAVPITHDFTIAPTAIALPIISYLIGSCILVPAIASLTSIYNRTNIMIISIAAFALFSLGCGLSQEINMFTLFRFLQGMAISVSATTAIITLLSAISNDELIKVMAKINIPALFGTAIGPLAGALFSYFLSWRIIFIINLPICLIIIIILIQNRQKLFAAKPLRQPFDWLGLILLSIFFSTISLAFEQLTHSLQSIYLYIIFIAILFAISYVLLWRFRRQKDINNSILDLSIFKNKDFLYGTIINIITRIAVCGLPVLLNIILQQIYKYSVIEAGYYLAIIAFAGVGAKFFSTLIEKLGLTKSVAFFSLLTSIALIMLATLDYFISKNILWSACALFGFSMSMLFTAMNSVMFISTSKTDMPNASNISTIINQIAIGLGVALALGGLEKPLSQLQTSVNAATTSSVLTSYHNTCFMLGLLLLSNFIVTIIRKRDNRDNRGQIL